MNNIENGQSAAEQGYQMKDIPGLEGLRVDKVDLKVHRLTANHGVGSSDPKYWKPFLQGCDIVNSSSKDEAASENAIASDSELTTPSE